MQAPGGACSVADPIGAARAIVSGKVTFTDGMCGFVQDQTGRCGVIPKQQVIGIAQTVQQFQSVAIRTGKLGLEFRRAKTTRARGGFFVRSRPSNPADDQL